MDVPASLPADTLHALSTDFSDRPQASAISVTETAQIMRQDLSSNGDKNFEKAIRKSCSDSSGEQLILRGTRKAVRERGGFIEEKIFQGNPSLSGACFFRDADFAR
jgi:hypothetical protein